MPHDGWREFLPYHISLWKTGTATVHREGAVMWYRLSPVNACSTGGTTGNVASHLQLEHPPSEVVQDKVFFTALLGSPATVSVKIGGTVIPAEWSTVPHGGVGLYHGSVSFSGATGPVTVTVSRGSHTVVKVDGETISNYCPNGLTNFNAWVGFNWGESQDSPLKKRSETSGNLPVSPPLSISEMVCTRGFGANNFAGLCSFTCQYGYCPEAACTCTNFGPQKELPEATGTPGFPLPGASPAYGGLCSFACNYGYCPPSACGNVDGGTAIPDYSPFLPLTCNKGTGPGNLAGLCDYSCNFG